MARKILYLGIAALAIATFAADLVCPAARRPGRHGNRSPSTPTTSAASSPVPQGPEAGVWVDRRNHGPADASDQERRHRRPGPLPRPGSAERQLRRLGPRLRPRRFAEDAGGAGQGAESEGGAGAERQGRRRVLPGAVLAVAAAAAAEERLPRHRSDTATASRRTCKSQGEWIRNIVNTDGCTGCHQMGNKATREIPESARHVRDVRRRVGSPHSVGPGRRRHERPLYAGRPSRARWRCGRTGPIASPPASCPSARRRARRAASATSS